MRLKRGTDGGGGVEGFDTEKLNLSKNYRCPHRDASALPGKGKNSVSNLGWILHGCREKGLFSVKGLKGGGEARQLKRQAEF